MKTIEKSSTLNLVSEVELARLRLVRVESELQSCEEQWRAARRRRKDAKEAARRVKHQLKRAKGKLLDAAQSLADAKTRLFKAGERELKMKQTLRKARKSPPLKAATARPRKKNVRLPARRMPPMSDFAPVLVADEERNERTVVAPDFQLPRSNSHELAIAIPI